MEQLRRPFLLLTLMALVAAPLDASDKKHPRLVNVESTRCTTCHEKLFQGKPVVHEPASEDCTACHDVELSEAGTRIQLTEPEPELCTQCHTELEAAAALELKAPHGPLGDSCVTCHDPHAAALPKLLAAPVRELCDTCHETADLQDVHGGQLTRRVDCRRCHSPHGSDNVHALKGSILHAPFEDGTCEGCHRKPFAGRVRLQGRGGRVCEACHGEIVELPAGHSLHAAVSSQNRQKGCLACHDPHMSNNARLLLHDGPELCRQCHAEIVQAALGEGGHAAAEDCLTCHKPHSAAENRLLTLPPGELCAECHDVEDKELKAKHLEADLAGLACLQCHTPHGSSHGKLLAGHLHEPVLDGCDTCHEGRFDQLIEDGESALCLVCHEDIGELAAKASVPHEALELGRCVDCHNPHASPQQRLVKLPRGEVCIECHSEQAATDGEVQHGAIVQVGCQACHEPHGGEQPKMLRTTGNELCLACHDTGPIYEQARKEPKVTLAGRFEISSKAALAIKGVLLSRDRKSGHPVPGHPLTGEIKADPHRRRRVTFEGELGCLACHDPHKGRSAQILRWGAASGPEACLKCHPK